MIADNKMKKKLIYIIDDDEDILELMKKIFLKLDMEVETFLSTNDFILRLKQRIPDLCFIDLNLGVHIGAGFQLIQAIRKKISEKIVLIVISSRDTAEDTALAIEMGADDYIIKPIKPALIEQKILQYLSSPDDDLLPMIPVPQEFRACTLLLEYYLYHLNENGFIILTPHFIPKNTVIEFNNGTLIEIMEKPFCLNVKHNWLHVDSELYAAQFIFPAEEQGFNASFRKWMILKSDHL